jgi:hypothetical protein
MALPTADAPRIVNGMGTHEEPAALTVAWASSTAAWQGNTIVT